MRAQALIALLMTASPALSAPDISLVADGFDGAWAIGFLPNDEGVLVTEKRGRLWMMQDGKRFRISGGPKVAQIGQGGLLDVMIPRDFATSREVFLSYAKDLNRGQGTALARGVLEPGARQLSGLKDVFVMTGGSSGGNHFGSRIVEAADGTLFMTIGERGDRDLAQDLGRHNGSVIRINRDGSVPADNPFARKTNAQPEIYSYGHRNPQGAALDADGQLWVHEHGARGGDEVNRIMPGANFGWPVISYGTHYSGFKIGIGTEADGMEQPAYYWDPSIAPSGLAIYSGKLNSDWAGDFLVGSLKYDMIVRLDGDTMTEAERIAAPETQRVRDVVEAPDGAIWFISEGNGAIYRMTP